MIQLLLLAGLGLVGVKLVAGKNATGTTSNAARRQTTSTKGTTGAHQGPGSGTGTGQGGNANQPWYNGAIVAGAGMGATAIAKGLLSLTATSTPSAVNEPDVDEVDLDQMDADVASSANSATTDSDDPGDSSDNSDSSDDSDDAEV